MASTPRRLTYQGIPVWRHAQVIQWTTQIVSGILVVALVVWFFANIAGAVQGRDIPHGFGFLDREYSTPIGHDFLPYESSDSFRYAILVGVTNTLFVSVIGVILATLLGIAVGVARMSNNWIVSKAALVYVEFFRNVPLLIQLFFWFYILLVLPPVLEGYVIGGKLYISNAGIWIPMVDPSGPGAAFAWLGIALVSVLAGFAVHRWQNSYETRTGQTSYPLLLGVDAALVIGALGWLVIYFVYNSSPFGISYPAPEGAFGRILGGFDIVAGLIALLVGLVMYTSSFIAEIVRAGVQSVGRGQTEAGRSVGLTGSKTLRYVTFPQALPVIVPPLISQWLNLTKNSSLAGAIGYSDLTNIAKTMTQTAPAISIFIIIMVAYLAMSLAYSLIGNLYNRTLRH